MPENQAQLPWDVILALVDVSDPPALALLSRVSYDFLTAAAPSLYRSIHIDSPSQLDLLLDQTSRAALLTNPSRITSLLSLSQTRHLTLNFSSHPLERLDPLPSFVQHTNTTTFTPVPLQSLTLILNPTSPKCDHGLLQSGLFHLFNPAIFSVVVAGPSSDASLSSLAPLPTIARPRPLPMVWTETGGSSPLFIKFLKWNRLERLVLRGSLPFGTGGMESTRPRHEIVLDLRNGEEHVGFPRRGVVGLRMGQESLSRARFARRVMELGLAGRAGKLKLLVGTEEEEERLKREIGMFGEPYQASLEVEVCLVE